ncbi:MAG: hypothetical protein NT045_04225 [Candidatus Aureabacteria bacterium]|nr:hypothetical protein [Candidatus Auribacterota bacterium]
MTSAQVTGIGCAVVAAILIGIVAIWPRVISSQPYSQPYQQASQAQELAVIQRKLDQIIALQNQTLSSMKSMRPQLERTWENTRGR